MKAKLLMLVGCLSLLVGCASYDSAFCRSDYCTDTSYIPNSYSDNADYSCGQRGGGMASCGGYADTSYSGGGCGSGGCGAHGGGDNLYGCKASVWDNIGGINAGGCSTSGCGNS
jgi:hypothetical protein